MSRGPAVLTDVQEAVLSVVKQSRPHAVPREIARLLDMTPGGVMRALDALTRRGFVTPVGFGHDEIVVYVATTKGRARKVAA